MNNRTLVILVLSLMHLSAIAQASKNDPIWGFFEEAIKNPEGISTQILGYSKYKGVVGKESLYGIFEATGDIVERFDLKERSPANSAQIEEEQKRMLSQEFLGRNGNFKSPRYSFYLFGAIVKTLEEEYSSLREETMTFWHNYLFDHFLITRKALVDGSEGEMMWMEEKRTALLSYKPSENEFYRKLVLTLLYPDFFSSLTKAAIPIDLLKTAKDIPLIYTFNYGEFDFKDFKINRGQTKKYGLFKYSGDVLSYSTFNFTQENAGELINEYRQLILKNRKLNHSLLEHQIWKPIEALTSGHNKFYYYPDGILKQFSLVSLDGIFNQEVLIAPHYVLTDQSFSSNNFTTKINKNRTFSIFANPNYELELSGVNKLTNAQEDLYQFATAGGSSVKNVSLVKNREDASGQLESVEDEVRVLNQILLENNWQGELFISQQATEHNIKRVKSPRVLHIASHYGRQSLTPSSAPTEETLKAQDLYMNAISEMRNAYDLESKGDMQESVMSYTASIEMLSKRLLAGEIDSIYFNNQVSELSQNYTGNMYSDIDKLVKQQMLAAGEDTSGFVGMYDAIYNPAVIEKTSHDWDNDPIIMNVLSDHDNGILMWGADEMIQRANKAYYLYRKYSSMDVFLKEEVTLEEIKASGILQEINVPNIDNADSIVEYIGNYFESELTIGVGGYVEMYADSGFENLDSILSANDIIGLNLKNTELVALSGCSSGTVLRDNDANTGYAPFFRKAGAKVVLASLWDVDDHATSLLMTRFYNNWIAGMSMSEALLSAQKDLKQVKGFENPVFWAGWVLYGYEN